MHHRAAAAGVGRARAERAMRRAQILAVGRLRDAGLRAACDDYYRRCSGWLRVSERELRDLPAAARAIPDRARAVLVALDERGQQLTSRQFADQLRGWVAGRELVLLIGGADGLDDPLRRRADELLSLGRMTFAHRHVRLLLAEQLYRAVSIIEGTPYHRG